MLNYLISNVLNNNGGMIGPNTLKRMTFILLKLAICSFGKLMVRLFILNTRVFLRNPMISIQ